MFRTSSCPLSGATTTAVAASGLPSKLGDSSAVGRGRIGRPDHDQQKTCPKHVDFYSKNKFEKLVRLVGFIIRIVSQCSLFSH